MDFKIKFLLIFLLMSSVFSFAQNNNFISNDSIDWYLKYTPIQLISEDSIILSDYSIILNNCDSSTIKYIQGLDYLKVIELLKNEQTDWATNLILCAIYEIDVFEYYVFEINTRGRWIEYSKDIDIYNWNLFLMKRQLQAPK